MRWTHESSQQHYRDVVAAARGALVGLDFDGTLAPIVDNPPEAFILPAMPDLLVRLCGAVGQVAIVTGRPAQQALDLGRFEDIAPSCPNLTVLGQYGNERWSSAEPRVISPEPPSEIARFLDDLPAVFADAGLAPWVENKGLAVAVHTRRLAEPTAAYRALLPLLTDLADRHDLVIEPGRLVIEARAAGMDKGIALRQLAHELKPTAMIFAGDDRGDLAAFAELATQHRQGLPALRICSGSPEEPRVEQAADVVLDGPNGVLAFFGQFIEDASRIGG